MSNSRGLVLRARSGFYTIETDEGDLVEARLRGRVKKERQASDLAVIGDRVEVERLDDGTGAITAVEPRERRFSRRQPGPRGTWREDVMVANPDLVTLVFAVDRPPPNPRLVDRFLVVAEYNEVPALIVANKVDLLGQEAASAIFGPYVRIGYHASHEQHSPRDLLDFVKAAEKAGFTAAMCSDHFYPWSEKQGQSGYAWSWLGAAMQATELPTGVVCAPGQRYHPAIIAQAAATLQVMFPDRLWVAIGSGQALNEHITGERWPSKQERNERLTECAQVIKALWAGETVNHRGHVTVEDARLYTRPERPPLLVGAAITPETAGLVGRWADALITVAQDDATLARVVAAFRESAGSDKPCILQVHLAYAETDDEARDAAWQQWRQNVHPSAVLTEVRSVTQMASLGESVRREDMDKAVRISSSVQRHVDWIGHDLERFDAVYLHEAGPEQRRFIEAFGRDVLPQLRP